MISRTRDALASRLLRHISDGGVVFAPGFSIRDQSKRRPVSCPFRDVISQRGRKCYYARLGFSRSAYAALAFVGADQRAFADLRALQFRDGFEVC